MTIRPRLFVALVLVPAIARLAAAQGIGQFISVEVAPPPQTGSAERVEYTFEITGVLAEGNDGASGGSFATQQAAAAAAARWLLDNWKQYPEASPARFRMVRVKGVPVVKRAPPVELATSSASDRLEGRFDRRVAATPRNLADVLQAKGYDAARVLQRAGKLSQFMGQVTDAALAEANTLVGQYNELATQMVLEGAARIDPLPVLDARAFLDLGPAAQRGTLVERALLVKTKLEEAALQIVRGELEAWKQALADEASQVQLDKASGRSVAARQQRLAEVLANWDSHRTHFQSQLDAYAHELDSLQNVRKQIRHEVDLASAAPSERPRRRETPRPAAVERPTVSRQPTPAPLPTSAPDTADAAAPTTAPQSTPAPQPIVAQQPPAPQPTAASPADVAQPTATAQPSDTVQPTATAAPTAEPQPLAAPQIQPVETAQPADPPPRATPLVQPAPTPLPPASEAEPPMIQPQPSPVPVQAPPPTFQPNRRQGDSMRQPSDRPQNRFRRGGGRRRR